MGYDQTSMTPRTAKTPAEREETAAKAQAWRDRCAAYRAAEAAAGVPVIPSVAVMEERIDRLWGSANPTPGFAPRCCSKSNPRVGGKGKDY